MQFLYILDKETINLWEIDREKVIYVWNLGSVKNVTSFELQ